MRSAFDVDIVDTEVAELPFGLVARRDDTAWVLAWSDDLAVLGGVGLWRHRSAVASIDLLVDHHAGVHARRAEIVEPDVRVWAVDEATVVPAVAAPLGEVVAADPDDLALTESIEAAGAEVVVEEGVVRAEFAGLEVGRVVRHEHESVIEVGVGFYDRQAGVLLHGERPPEETLRDVVALVASYRRPGAAPHPLNRMARSRWLRAVAIDDPATVGSASLRPVEPIPARIGLLDDVPAAAFDPDGRRLVVASIAGDPALLPMLADLVRRHEPSSVEVLTPTRDVFGWIQGSLDDLPVPGRVTGVTPPWAIPGEN